jgi:hypothetical protein
MVRWWWSNQWRSTFLLGFVFSAKPLYLVRTGFGGPPRPFLRTLVGVLAVGFERIQANKMPAPNLTNPTCTLLIGHRELA